MPAQLNLHLIFLIGAKPIFSGTANLKIAQSRFYKKHEIMRMWICVWMQIFNRVKSGDDRGFGMLYQFKYVETEIIFMKKNS
jgi:hypothetical protein